MTDAAVFSECQDILDTRPLRQGDVIRSVVEKSDVWDSLGIIVTADCDIAQDKHLGRLSFVPVLPIEFYLALYYLPRRLRRLSSALTDELVKMIHAAQKRTTSVFIQPVSRERVQRWLVEATPGRVANTLALEGTERDRLLKLGDLFVRAQGAPLGDYVAHRQLICESEVLLKRSPTELVAEKKLGKDISGHLKDLPGDAMFITSLGQIYNSGYVAYLRILRELRDDQVAIRASQRSFDVTYERVSRLRPPYSYALTQRLAAVFSAIGLPAEYENSRESIGLRLGAASEEVG